MVNGIGGTQLTANGLGDIEIQTFLNGRILNRTIRKFLYVPGLEANLFSITAVTHLGMKVVFY